jgi:hypothetical protein
MLLSSTTDTIQATLSVATSSVDYTIAYAVGDKTTSPMAVKDGDTVSGNITAVGPTTVLGSPAAANDRWQIIAMEFSNIHATIPVDLTVTYVKAGGAARRMKKVTLLPGESLARDKNGIWFHYDANGGVKTALAAPSTRVVLTAGTGATYTTPAGCRAIDVECVGGGGAGGGSASVAASGGAGGGGGSGGITRKLFSPPAATYTYTVGAAGAAGAAGANNGGAGGDTTFGTLTAKGGSGGIAAAAAAATRALGGAGGVVGSGGDINGAGEPGRTGIVSTAALVASGAGGPSEAGGGAPGVTAQGNGVAAAANSGGGGSGGAMVNAGAAVAGGAGGSGIVIVTEYY